MLTQASLSSGDGERTRRTDTLDYCDRCDRNQEDVRAVIDPEPAI